MYFIKIIIIIIITYYYYYYYYYSEFSSLKVYSSISSKEFSFFMDDNIIFKGFYIFIYECTSCLCARFHCCFIFLVYTCSLLVHLVFYFWRLHKTANANYINQKNFNTYNLSNYFISLLC